MNARTFTMNLSVENQQVDEVALSLFSTIMLYRTYGKIFYGSQGHYTLGAVGMEEFVCDFIDLTYIAVSSPLLKSKLKGVISQFSEELRQSESKGKGTGEITLEFYQKKPNVKFMYLAEPHISWEMWTIQLNLLKFSTESDRQTNRENLGDILSDKIFYIAQLVNKPDYVPRVPSEAELGYIFDLSYPDIHPFLHKLYYSVDGGAAGISIPKGFTNMLKEVFF